ncbi:MAG: hypothetical protein EG826_13615 [Deltaproteobacteria bacterium]|nr:hypothetical protein [Deltaproteobacteria bacterium]
MKKIRSIALSFLVSFLFAGPAMGADDWEKNYTDANGDVVLYKLEQRDAVAVQVWGKRIFSDVGREEFLRDRRENGFSTKGWENLGHFTSLYEINCPKKLGRLLSVVIYGTDGKIVYADSFGRPDWDDILPDTVGDTLQKKVCK